MEDALGLQDCLLGLEERQAGPFELAYPSLGHVGLAYQRVAFAKGLLQLGDQGVCVNEPRGKLPGCKHLPDLREAAVHREAYRLRELVSWQLLLLLLRHVIVAGGLSLVGRGGAVVVRGIVRGRGDLVPFSTRRRRRQAEGSRVEDLVGGACVAIVRGRRSGARFGADGRGRRLVVQGGTGGDGRRDRELVDH